MGKFKIGDLIMVKEGVHEKGMPESRAEAGRPTRRREQLTSIEDAIFATSGDSVGMPGMISVDFKTAKQLSQSGGLDFLKIVDKQYGKQFNRN